MTETTQPQLTQEQLAEWVRHQFQRANKHLAEKGVLFESVVTEKSRYLAPFLAIWKIKSTDGKFYWVMSGDLPVDFTAESNAETARDVLNYFAMAWQLKAEDIRNTGTQDQTQIAFADLLQARAENLFTMYRSDSIWQNEGA